MSQPFTSTVLRDARRIVVKVGSSLVTNEGRGLDEAAIGEWCRQLAALTLQGRELIMVSSGAIAEGMKRLGWTVRPREINELQAAAAVGQMGMVQVYESCFRSHGLLASQILLTHEDLADRKRYLNARSTLRTLLDLGVIPVINSLEQARRWAWCGGEGRPAALQIDSGMARLGLSGPDVVALAADRALLDRLSIKLIMSHLACADEPGRPANRIQAERFRLMAAHLPPAPLSLANSGGVGLGEAFHMDLVRLGVSLYGVDAAPGARVGQEGADQVVVEGMAGETALEAGQQRRAEHIEVADRI